MVGVPISPLILYWEDLRMDSYVVVDLETTGLSTFKDEIIEIGAWKVKDQVVVEKFCTLVKPVRYISRECQSITGITNDMLRSELGIEDLMPSFVDFCEDLPFLAHNINFDYGFLKNTCERLSLDITLKGCRTGIDTLDLCRKYLRGSISNKLCNVAEYFKINLQSNEGFHRASYDSYITKLVYDRLILLYPNIDAIIRPTLIGVKDDSNFGKPTNTGVLSFE